MRTFRGMSRRRHVIVVGSGFCGTLTAVQLAELVGDRVQITLLDERPGVGGIAYGAPRPEHLLNVPARNMGAFPRDPGHFARWLRQSGRPGKPDDYVPRRLYGEYLATMLRVSRVRRVEQRVVEVTPEDDSITVVDARGDRWSADLVVLATGPLPPVPPGPVAADSPDYVADPWSTAAWKDVPADAPVLLLGTGLTMVDVLLSLRAAGHRGPVRALSRRGLLPRAHVAHVVPSGEIPPDASLSSLLRWVRHRSRGAEDWRGVIDGLRPFTPRIWSRLSMRDRSRFLRHLRPWWDAHRHRLAPALAAQVQDEVARGSLVVTAGRILGMTRRDEGLEVTWRPRGDRSPRTEVARRVVNCTGPSIDLRTTAIQPWADLRANGWLVPDALGLGLVATAVGHLVDANGRPNPRLFATGPLRQGATWEATAIPELRAQVRALVDGLVATLAGRPAQEAAAGR